MSPSAQRPRTSCQALQTETQGRTMDASPSKSATDSSRLFHPGCSLRSASLASALSSLWRLTSCAKTSERTSGGRLGRVTARRSLRFVFFLMMSTIVICCWWSGGQAVAVRPSVLRGDPSSPARQHIPEDERSEVFCRTRGIHSEVCVCARVYACKHSPTDTFTPCPIARRRRRRRVVAVGGQWPEK